MRHIATLLVAFTLLSRGTGAIQASEESVRFPSAIDHLTLSMRHCAATGPHRSPPILILHGATFPSANAAAWKMGGRSWMDELAASATRSTRWIS